MIKIAIDPLLKEKFGPEICWTWRFLLTGIGLPWEEVPLNSQKYDIAYLTKDTAIGDCALCIRANPCYWENRSNYKLVRLGETQGWQYPILEDAVSLAELYHITDGKIIFEQDIIFYLFWLVSGQEERHCQKDKHGHINLNGSLFSQGNILQAALASNIGFNLEKQLMKLGVVPAIKRWPQGKIAAACVSHDVDYPQAIKWLEPLRILQRQGLGGFKAVLSLLNGKSTYWNFTDWVALEKAFNIRSAFYFVARQGSLYKYLTGTPDPFYDIKSERFRELFQYLKDEGFEIGLHASYRAFESRERLVAEKEMLQKASGQIVLGNRHHYWHMDPDNSEATLLLHEEINLKYDTSLGHERYLGWRRSSSWPFFPFHQQNRKEIKVLQVPIAWMDNHFFGYRKENPGDPDQILRALSDKVAEQGGCLLVNIHDYVFDHTLFPGWVGTYRKLLEYLRERGDFWMETPGRIAEYWIDRYNSILQSSTGLIEGYK